MTEAFDRSRMLPLRWGRRFLIASWQRTSEVRPEHPAGKGKASLKSDPGTMTTDSAQTRD